MKLNDILTEKVSQSYPMIVVDVQPEYHKWCEYIMPRFVDFMNSHSGRVLAYYNGQGLTNDEMETVKHYYREMGMNEERVESIEYIEKDYGWFRAWMDNGVSEGDIIKILREMMRQKINDSRDLEPSAEEVFEELVGEMDGFNVEDDPIYFPYIEIGHLREFNGALLCGGGEHECLKEIQLLMSAYNIKYKLFKKLIY
jgi:hypothetical protein